MGQLIFLGAPGSGKGTQASKLVKNYSLEHISTGDLLRSEIAKETALGKRVQEILKAGKLVDDKTVLELLKASCDIENNKYIFDGFPRNIEQAKLLDEHIINSHKATAIYFKIDTDVLVERIVNRRVAKKSGEIYNLLTRPPKVEGKCDISGEDLIHREDDKEATVRARMEVFSKEINQLLDYYKEQSKLVEIDASNSAELIFKKLEEVIIN